MSDRLTSEWTKTTDEAFGASGTKGRLGEEFLARVFEAWGWDYITHSDNYDYQIEGKDISFKRPEWARFYTGDAKNNMDDTGKFFVHKDWLFKVKCDRIFHVNPNTGWLVWYGVDEMRKVYDTSKEYIAFTPGTRPSFVKAANCQQAIIKDM
jgi:hypothetical protein